jgi:cytochrome c-type biogenesis protein CcmI
MATIIAYILSITACAFVLYPLLRKSRDERLCSLSSRQRELSDLQWQINRVRSTLRELELDYQTGKLSPEDYNQLSDDQEKRLKQAEQHANVLTGVDKKQLVQELEKEIVAHRQVHDHEKNVELTCPQCGNSLRDRDKFCSNCGTQISKS